MTTLFASARIGLTRISSARFVPTRPRAALIAALFVILALGGFNSPAASGNPYRGLLVDPPRPLRSLMLVDHFGRRTKFPAKNGRWQLVFFGYTHCGSVCPLSMQKMKVVLHEMGADRDKLDFLFISIDKQRDNPKNIKKFLSRFDSRILGLTGRHRRISSLQRQFKIVTRRYQGGTALGYRLEHSIFLYLLNGKGQIRLMYPSNASPDDLTRDLKLILNAG